MSVHYAILGNCLSATYGPNHQVRRHTMTHAAMLKSEISRNLVAEFRNLHVYGRIRLAPMQEKLLLSKLFKDFANE